MPIAHQCVPVRDKTHTGTDSYLLPDAGDSCSLPSVNPHRPRIVAPDRSLLVTYAQGRRRPAEEDVDLDDEEYSDSDQACVTASHLILYHTPYLSCFPSSTCTAVYTMACALHASLTPILQSPLNDGACAAGVWREQCPAAGLGCCGLADRAPG